MYRHKQKSKDLPLLFLFVFLLLFSFFLFFCGGEGVVGLVGRVLVSFPGLGFLCLGGLGALSGGMRA